MNSVWKSITPSSAWPTLALDTEAFFLIIFLDVKFLFYIKSFL
ncbi:MAG: hypothetical protein PWQ37_809 [Candidatus Petromonas sp.]|jgi:hypothetical protein|nr:hypothetical protein [Candidatus Petromonas sp.]